MIDNQAFIILFDIWPALVVATYINVGLYMNAFRAIHFFVHKHISVCLWTKLDYLVELPLPIRTTLPYQRTATAGVNAGCGSQWHGYRLASCQSTRWIWCRTTDEWIGELFWLVVSGSVYVGQQLENKSYRTLFDIWPALVLATVLIDCQLYNLPACYIAVLLYLQLIVLLYCCIFTEVNI